MAHLCPVCGYPKLGEPPRSHSGGASYEICPSCGFQFGVSDDDMMFTYDSWRQIWQEGGQRWASKARPALASWDPEAQLQNLRKPARQVRQKSPVPAKPSHRKT